MEEYEREFKPFYDVAEAGKTAVWEFSQMFGEEDSDSESGDESDDGTRRNQPIGKSRPSQNTLHFVGFFRGLPI